jgi:hypothetical protein
MSLEIRYRNGHFVETDGLECPFDRAPGGEEVRESIKHECLRHIVPLGEQRLRNVIHECVTHYHAERHHQGLGNVIPFPSPVSPAASADPNGSVDC